MIGLGFLIAASALPSPSGFRPLPDCTPARQDPCIVRHEWDSKDLAMRLGSSDWTWWLDHDHLTVVSRLKQYPWLLLCCDVQTPLEPIPGTDLVGITVVIPAMDRAILQVIPAPMAGKPVIIRGPAAPRELERSAPLKGRLYVRTLSTTGKEVSRKISIYVPPGSSKFEKLPVLYLADDLAVDFAPIAERAILNGKAPRAILVGVSVAPMSLQCANSGCDQRSEEYLTDTISMGKQNNQTYDKNRAFFLRRVIPFIERNFPASRKRADRCIGGTSNGASWALTMAEASPKKFGCVMAFSAGSKVAVEFANRLKNVKLSAGYGTLDVKFAGTTKNIAMAARSAGADVREYSIVAGHSIIAWEYLFASSYPEMFSALQPTSARVHI